VQRLPCRQRSAIRRRRIASTTPCAPKRVRAHLIQSGILRCRWQVAPTLPEADACSRTTEPFSSTMSAIDRLLAERVFPSHRTTADLRTSWNESWKRDRVLPDADLESQVVRLLLRWRDLRQPLMPAAERGPLKMAGWAEQPAGAQAGGAASGGAQGTKHRWHRARAAMRATWTATGSDPAEAVSWHCTAQLTRRMERRCRRA